MFARSLAPISRHTSSRQWRRWTTSTTSVSSSTALVRAHGRMDVLRAINRCTAAPTSTLLLPCSRQYHHASLVGSSSTPTVTTSQVDLAEQEKKRSKEEEKQKQDREFRTRMMWSGALPSLLSALFILTFEKMRADNEKEIQARDAQIRRAQEYYKFLSFDNPSAQFGCAMLSGRWDDQLVPVPKLPIVGSDDIRTFQVDPRTIRIFFQEYLRDNVPNGNGTLGDSNGDKLNFRRKHKHFLLLADQKKYITDELFHRMCLSEAIKTLVDINYELKRGTLSPEDLSTIRIYRYIERAWRRYIKDDFDDLNQFPFESDDRRWDLMELAEKMKIIDEGTVEKGREVAEKARSRIGALPPHSRPKRPEVASRPWYKYFGF